ncbi:scavenger receptor cysteine-rich domain superfamily protein-like isoform X2 [Pecten maximus]|uniref:scavenger receptor cysteine-rich domain superfamily protein-like isoform X2 n=1 Tax=Pecten maximus TaxID=6579 RepID=UPI001457F222|nr:scavenger receptor cysteine-rich domain superfamily protein-like isoform X2 [Pecten maximus]
MAIFPVIQIVRLIFTSVVVIAFWTYIVQSCIIYSHHFDDDSRKAAYFEAKPYGPLQCGKMCVLERRCVAINYHRESLTCELVEASATAVGDSEGWISTSNFTFVNDKLGPCANVAIEDLDRCVPLKNTGHSNVKKYCPEYPTSQHATLTSYSRTCGDSITYKCNSDRCYLEEYVNVTCNANGQWSSVTATCTVMSENSLRLLDGATPNRGRVQICHNSIWGTVCDHSWDTNDALVVCRQLGYSGGQPFMGAVSSGQIWLHLVSCTGTESFLASCSHDGWTDPHCVNVNSDGAGAICDP